MAIHFRAFVWVLVGLLAVAEAHSDGSADDQTSSSESNSIALEASAAATVGVIVAGGVGLAAWHRSVHRKRIKALEEQKERDMANIRSELNGFAPNILVELSCARGLRHGFLEGQRYWIF